jgi:Na+/H+ antiporter NhaD/arsenite permease-like protein
MSDSTPVERLTKRHKTLYVGHPDAHVPGYELADHPSPRPSAVKLAIISILSVVIAVIGYKLHHWAEGSAQPTVALPWVIPFALLLGSIALMPFVARHWWEHNYARVAIALGVIVGGFYLFGIKQTNADGGLLGSRAVALSMAEYISFILLLGSLFIVSGGILIRVRTRATPMTNTGLMLIGAIIANLFGTTGASMLLIRPFLRINKGHIRPYHIVFFIFIVSNAGGSLTPIGDPPLFLGFLQGVPFWWVLEHCWPIWLLVVLGLLAMFFVIDTIHARRDARPADSDDLGPTVSIYGGGNLLFVGLIIAGILLHAPINTLLYSRFHFGLPVRELLMIVASVGSLVLTPRRIHAENQFNYAPIKEVAYLFVGIFLTMIPALNYLYHESGKPDSVVQVKTPGQYYFASGTLSAVLDNAPTYLTFLQSKLGQLDKETVGRAIAIARRDGHEVTPADTADLSEQNREALTTTIEALKFYHGDRVAAGNLSEAEVRVGFLVGDPHLNLNLVAISMGAVLFGAFTYIGNGPNFMVKSIADHAGVKTPSFFGYVFRFSVPFLLPWLVLTWWLFLRG